MMDTIAHLHFELGNKAKALEIQKAAMKIATPDEKAQLQTFWMNLRATSKERRRIDFDSSRLPTFDLIQRARQFSAGLFFWFSRSLFAAITVHKRRSRRKRRFVGAGDSA